MVQFGMPLYPLGFIEPCLPTVSRLVPTGPEWAFEIKHDGFRFICLRDGKLARLHPRLLARLDLCHHKLELARGRDVERLDGLRDGGVLVLRAASGGLLGSRSNVGTSIR